MLKGLAILAIVLTGLLSSDEAKVKTIDRRTASEESRYFLVFCACGGTDEATSLTGHAFVVVGKEDAENQVCTQAAFGFYPVKDGDVVKSAFKTVPGEVVDEVTKGSLAATTNRLIVEVNKPAYEKAEAVRKKWAEKGEYRLILKDCVTFTKEIATEIGLTIPDRSGFDNLPQKYILALMNAND